MRRVVVTGLGVVAPNGNNVADAWASVLTGKSAAGRISLFDASPLPVQIAAEVHGFDPVGVMGAKQARQSSRFVQFAAVAAEEAITDAGLETGCEGDRCGCSIGVGVGGMDQIEEATITLRDRGYRRVSPLFVPYMIPNMAAGYVALAHGLRGPNLGTTTACASGSHAIGEAFLHLRAGTAEAMVAGGTEAPIAPLSVAAFARMHALSTRNDAPREASRPFDLQRDGFVIGEGCGLLVLEEYSHAVRRGAKIYAEMLAYGLSADAYHITSPPPDGNGIARAIRSALQGGGICLDEIDHINAHGTSTPANDASESAAIESVFGQCAAKLAVSSTKGVTGHCLGGAGGIEAVFTVLAVSQSRIPPTANYTWPDPDCRLDYVGEGVREQKVRFALSNSCGFGGQNACLAFRRLESANP